MTSAIKKGSLRQVCDWQYGKTAWLICAEIFLPIIFMHSRRQQRSGILGCCCCIHQKYFGASKTNIWGYPQIISQGICQKYFGASSENILSGLEQFLCNATNQVWQIRLCWLQPAWHIYCPGKFETLVNLSFHSYIFFVPKFTKTSGFWNVTRYLQRAPIAVSN